MKTKFVVAPRGSEPAHVKCDLCNKMVKAGDVVVWKRIPNVINVAWHHQCMLGLLDSAPLNIENREHDNVYKWNVIRSSMENFV
jgi:hypothetical protein